MNMTYSLTSLTERSGLKNSIVSLSFHDLGDKWGIDFRVKNGTTTSAITSSISISNSTSVNTTASSSNTTSNNSIREISGSYTKDQLLRTEAVTQDDEMFTGPIESSILAIRDIAREPKYLVVGAVWNKIFTGSTTIDAKIQGTETTTTPAGTFDVYVLQYPVGNSQSKIYVNRDLPLPVKAQVYNDNDRIVYEYTLENLSR